MGYVTEKIKADSAERRADYAKFEELILRARELGLDAGNAARPQTMIVGTPTTIFGNDIDRSKPVYVVPEGVCGFGWVHIMDGRSRFVNWLKKKKLGRPHHDKGWVISCSDFNQSMERKEAYCRAYARVLSEAGIECYADSRMD